MSVSTCMGEGHICWNHFQNRGGRRSSRSKYPEQLIPLSPWPDLMWSRMRAWQRSAALLEQQERFTTLEIEIPFPAPP
jgi:hypothetical protein